MDCLKIKITGNLLIMMLVEVKVRMEKCKNLWKIKATI